MNKAQSAMEYLMTYGWAILVIAIVLGVLYYFGVFGGARIGTSCIAAQGYFCNSPILNSTGNLSVMFAQDSGGAITITQLGCSQNATAPTSMSIYSGNVLESGNQVKLVFQCPPSAAGPIGKQFDGYLWITYSNGVTAGLVAKIATIVAVVSSVGAVGAGNSVFGYVPITITNSQGSATGASFQDLITVNSGTYGNYINSGWSNVEFSTGAGGGGSILPAWVESNPTNSGSTAVWVKLSGSIPAGSNTVIYMDFLKSNVLSASGPTGEAPQLSCTTPSNTISGCGSNQYAEYDDGSQVFTFYDNFAGASDSSWTSNNIGSGTGVVFANSVTLISITGGTAEITSAASTYSPGLFESDVAYVPGYSGGVLWIGYSLSSYSNGACGARNYNNAELLVSVPAGSGFYLDQCNGGTFSETGPQGSAATTGIWGAYWPANGVEGAWLNGAPNAAFTVTGPAPGPSYLVLESITQTTVRLQYAHLSVYPPNDVMPSASFGSYV